MNDAEKFCKNLEAGVTVLGCLRDKKDELTSDCKAEVFERQTGAADDWRTDIELFNACEVRFLLHRMSQALLIMQTNMSLVSHPILL